MSIEPSQADRIAAQQAVENAIEGLNSSEGTEAVASNSKFVVNRITAPASRISDQKLKDFATSHEAGQAALINRTNDSYTIAKMLSTSTDVDSINFSVAQYATGSNLDSIAALLNANTLNFAGIIDNVTVQGQDSIWGSLDGMTPKIKDALANAAIGKAFVLTDTIQGVPASSIVKVNRRHAPVPFYEMAIMEYTVDPSVETLTDLTSKLRTYISNNSSADEFKANAAEAGYSVLNTMVGPSSFRIGSASDSRQFVKWAMEAKKGQVSPLLQDTKQSYLLAMAVSDIYDDYLPYNADAIKNQLRAEALSGKKADKLMADYAGKASDLAGYAGAMGVEVAEGDVAFTSPLLLNLGINESELQGAIAAAPKGTLVGPVKGKHGILVFEVRDINTDNRPFNEAEYGARFLQAFGLGRVDETALLLGKDKIDNRSLNFVQAVGE